LTKLVYFERVELSDRHNSMHNFFSAVQDRFDTNQSSVHKRSRSNEHLQESFNNKFDMNDNTTHLKMKSSPSRKVKKITSCLDLAHSFKHEAALKNFYNFARNNDNYGETGVKEKQLSFYSRELGGELHFIRFETRSMENALDLIKDNNLHVNIKRMGATGGGAHKYAQDWERIVGIQMNKHEELECMVVGMQFILSYVVGECYTFKPNVDQNESSKADEDKPRPINDNWWSRKIQRDSVIDKTTYPYLLVTIGTGVSILRIDGSRKYSRVSGSTIGGGTYWGLCRLLTSAEHFEDVLNLAKQGDPSKVDMMVGDIYGNNKEGLEKLGLPADIVASSFGKLVAKLDPASGLEESDLARALLLMITNNIGQVAYLNALLHKTPRIYFVGNFLRHNNLSERRLAYAIDYWSGGEMEALFLEHEGYFGSLGAFLLNQESQPRRDESAGGGLFQDFIDDAVAAKILENRFFRKFRLNSTR